MIDDIRENRIRAYWEDPDTVSMYDEYLATLEAEMVAGHVRPDDHLLDLGCGDGTGSRFLRQRCRSYVGVDLSRRMLSRFALREPGWPLVLADLRALPFGRATRWPFTAVVAQRVLVNLPNAATQEAAIRRLASWVPPGGRLLLCEAFREGVERLNALRTHLGCKPLAPAWHNVHLDRATTARALAGTMDLVIEQDLSVYYFLTRVVHQALVGDAYPEWNSPINRIAFQIARSPEAPAIAGYSTILLQVWQARSIEERS